MPRVNAYRTQSTAADSTSASTSAADRNSKPLLSQVDEIGAILSSLTAELPHSIQHTPSVQVWIDAFKQQRLQWSALPATVDASSTNMGLSTAKSDKKRAKKLQQLDMEKVNARVLRKRQQVESFLAVLQPLLTTISSTQWRHQQQQQQHRDNDSRLHEPAAAGQAQPQQQQQQHGLRGSFASQHGGDQLLQQQQVGGGIQAVAAPTGCHLDQQQQQQQIHAQQQQHHNQQQKLDSSNRLHIVDFGCGSGNLLLPLAALFPCCRFTGVDMKPAALQLLKQRAAAAGLDNIQAFEGMIEHYREPFDIALALHACGNATDHVLRMAVDRQAAFIVSPCCVGKLKFSMTGGSSFHSSSITWTPRQPGDKPPAAAAAVDCNSRGCPLANQQQAEGHQQQQQSCHDGTAPAAAAEHLTAKLHHPRSTWLRSQLPEPERHFRIMARVADIAHAPADQALLGEALAQRAAVAHNCKRFVELDRCAVAAEAGYAVGLFKVCGAETMAKNDLLVGVPTAAVASGSCGDSSGGSVLRGLLVTVQEMGLSVV